MRNDIKERRLERGLSQAELAEQEQPLEPEQLLLLVEAVAVAADAARVQQPDVRARARAQGEET